MTRPKPTTHEVERRERLWMSPACLHQGQEMLSFDAEEVS